MKKRNKNTNNDHLIKNDNLINNNHQNNNILFPNVFENKKKKKKKIKKNYFNFLKNFYYFIIFIISIICFINTLQGNLVFDDEAAIMKNQDLRPNVPIWKIIEDDFWGTPVASNFSHKSYRPFTVLTFRINYLYHNLDSSGYHLVNIILHAINSVLIMIICENLHLSTFSSFISSLLFATHPIHTDCVSSIVGRAEVLCGIFYLLAFLFFIKSCNYNSENDNDQENKKISIFKIFYLILSIIFYICSTFSKEQGFTLPAILFISDISSWWIKKKNKNINFYQVLIRQIVIWITFIFLVYLRFKIVNNIGNLDFDFFVSPVIWSKSKLTRILTFSYYHFQHFYLLLVPINLSADYSFNSIPNIENIKDFRNIYTLSFYMIIFIIGIISLVILYFYKKKIGQLLLLSLSFMIIPFIPASNIFFYVGFVVAERIMYTPSIGFCLLIGTLIHYTTKKNWINGKWIGIFMMVIILLFGYKTVKRNEAWLNSNNLWEAEYFTHPTNIRAITNLAIVRRTQGRYEDAIRLHKEALTIYKNCELYTELALTQELAGFIDDAYKNYHFILKNYGLCGNMALNFGNMLLRNKRFSDAAKMLSEATKTHAYNPEVFHNLAVSQLELGELNEAIKSFKKAIQLNPAGVPSYHGLVIALKSKGDLREALYWAEQCYQLDKSFRNIGNLLNEIKFLLSKNKK